MASGFASFSTDDSTKGDSNIARRKEFKRTVTQEDGRRKRNENAIQIRKNKRAEGLRKRRAMRRAPVNGAADAGNSLAALANTAVSGMPTVAAIEHLETYKMGTFTLMRRRAAHSCELPCAGVGETLTRVVLCPQLACRPTWRHSTTAQSKFAACCRARPTHRSSRSSRLACSRAS